MGVYLQNTLFYLIHTAASQVENIISSLNREN